MGKILAVSSFCATPLMRHPSGLKTFISPRQMLREEFALLWGRALRSSAWVILR